MSKDHRKDNRLTIVPNEKNDESVSWGGPDDSLLPGHPIAAPPAFPLEAMGLSKDWVAVAARGANVHPDYVAASLLASVGAVCGKMYEVYLSSDWREPIALWLFCIGAPSSGKTPALKPARAALDHIEAKLREVAEARIKRHIVEAKQADDVELVEALENQLLQLPRLVVQDSTREQLAHVEVCSDRGLLIFCDELAGLLRALEQYTAGVDRPYYLEAWSGGVHRVDRRAKDGNAWLEDHLFSLLGNIQPDKLREIFPRQESDDGFAARALMVWPDVLPRRGVPPGADHAPLHRALRRLALIPHRRDGKKRVLKPSDKAFGAFERWYDGVDQTARHTVDGKLASAYGKFPGQVARLAGMLHLLDWAFGDSRVVPGETLTKGTLQRAIALVEDYFRPQARRVYEGLDASPARLMAATILERARENTIRRFNARTAQREWKLPGARRDDAAHIRNAALQLLERGNWIRSTGRSNSLDFEVNPALFSVEEP